MLNQQGGGCGACGWSTLDEDYNVVRWPSPKGSVVQNVTIDWSDFNDIDQLVRLRAAFIPMGAAR